MKKLLAIVLMLVLTAALFAGCGGSKTEDKGLFKVNLEEYMTVGDYKGIKISPDDDNFLAVLKEQQEYDLANCGYGEEGEIASGKVQLGDTANITYVGTINNVPFEGGTETKGFDLVIGSNSFIDGFEEGLIGKEIGSTVKLNLKFPEDYGKEELNGKDVVFTVNIKFVKRTVYPDINEEIAKKLGYKNLEEYNAYCFTSAVKIYCYEKVIESAKMTRLPVDDVEYFLDYQIKNEGVEETIAKIRSTAEHYGVSFEECTGGKTEEEYRTEVVKQLKEQVEAEIIVHTVLYYIAQVENLIPTADDVEKEYKTLADFYSTSSSQISVSEMKKILDYNQVEYNIVYENVLQLLFENAEIGE